MPASRGRWSLTVGILGYTVKVKEGLESRYSNCGGFKV